MTGSAATPPPNLGQTWVHRDTGERVVIHGARSRTWVLADARQPITADAIREIPRAALAEYRYDACDHRGFCCLTHQTHVSPHLGCLLR